MSIASVVTRGYGSFGSVPLVVTAGYSIGAANNLDGLKPRRRRREKTRAERDADDIEFIMQRLMPFLYPD